MFRKLAIGSLFALGLGAASLSSAQAGGVQPGSGAALAGMSGSTVQQVWHHGYAHPWGWGWNRPHWGPRCHWERHWVKRKGKWVRVSRRVCW